jgi:diadenosine tetraphosphate (Ap4A) HIT family hydrolase
VITAQLRIPFDVKFEVQHQRSLLIAFLRGAIAEALAWAAAGHVARAIASVARPDGTRHITEDDLTGRVSNLVAHWKLHLIARFRNDAVRLDWGREPDPGEATRIDIATALRADIARDV